MKVLKYNILDPENSEDLGSDARIRFQRSQNNYIEIHWERGTNTLKVTKQSFHHPPITIIPVVSNSIELA